MAGETTIDSSMSQQAEHVQPDAASQGYAPLGEVLLAARNAKNLTQKDVSDSLRLSVKQVNALENNEFSALPEAVITRGFIRNYARFLEVDAEPLLASYRVRVPEKLPGTLSVQTSMHQVVSGEDSQPWLKYILGSILVLLFVVAWFIYIEYMPKPEKLPDEKVAAAIVTNTQPTEMPLPEIALPAAERQADSGDVLTGTDATTSNASVANAEINSTALANALPNVTASNESTKENTSAILSNGASLPTVAVDSKTLKASAERAAQVQVTPDGKTAIKVESPEKVEVNDTLTTNKVSMTFSEQTWVRVTDKSGKVIFEKTLPAGAADGFDGEPPFNVVIGNAVATKLMYSGQQIDLASSTKNNVARLTLE